MQSVQDRNGNPDGSQHHLDSELRGEEGAIPKRDRDEIERGTYLFLGGLEAKVHIFQVLRHD
jgi:hypothetical protein